MKRQFTFAIILSLILVLLGACGSQELDPSQFKGTFLPTPIPAPDFALSNAAGDTVHLSDYEGEIVLLYFGYTFCPDVCPTTLYDLSMLTQSLEEQAGDIQVAMVTVDPQRDTLDKLGSYVTTFDPTFLGLSGDSAKLEAVWQAYGVYRAENQVEGAAGYLVDHTARIYVIDPQGELRLTFPFGISWQAMADDLKHLMGE